MNRVYIILVSVFLISNAQAQTPLWKQVVAGGEFSVAIKSDSTLYSWGLNNHGQLANGDLSDNSVLEPTQVTEYNDWITVAAGSYHAVAIKDSGSIYAWGYNGYGSIKDSDTLNFLEPVKVSTETEWVKVFAGLHTSFAINSKGHLYGWGKNRFGQLGIDTEGLDITEPTVIDSIQKWEKVASGHDFTIFLDSKGNLYGSGKNDKYQLTAQFGGEVHELVILDTVETYVDIAANYATGHAITEFSEIVAWGSNQYAESGSTSNFLKFPEISQTDFSSGYTSIFCGSVYCLAEKDNKIYGFGTNVLGGIGVATPKQIVQAELISEDRYENISVSIGLSDGLEIYGGHTLWLKQFDKSHYCGSGANYVGQLGNGLKSENASNLQCDIGTIQVSIIERPEFTTILVYPNPTTDIINFEVPDVQLEFLALYSMEGKRVFHKKIEGQHTQLDLSSFNRGMYILYIMDINGNKFTSKVVKN